MKIVIVGCGRVGSSLAQRLEDDGHEVTVVDRTHTAFRRLPPRFKGHKVTGEGFDRTVLEEAGIRATDALISVTNGDNSNILTARIAREIFSVPRVVARIYDVGRATVYERMGVQTVQTTAITSEQILLRILPSAERQEWTDTSGQAALIIRELSDEWIGRRIAELDEPGRVRLVAVARFGKMLLDVEGLLGQEGDALYLLVSVNDG